MKFSRRLGLSAGIALVVLVVALLFSILGLYQAQQRTNHFLLVDQVMYEQEILIYSQGLQNAQAIRNIVMNPANEAAQKMLVASGQSIESAALKLRELATQEPETLAMVSKLLQLRDQQQKVHSEIVAGAGDLRFAVDKIAKDETPIWRDIRLLISKSIEDRRQKMHDAETDLSEFMGRTAIISAIIGAVGTLIGIVLMVLLSRGILRQLGGDPAEAAHVAHVIAQGDFTQSIALAPNDSTSLMYSMAQMQDSLAEMAQNIQEAAESIDVAANEISLGNIDLSARTNSQAAGLEQTAAAMEQITSTVRLNADNAAQGNRLASQASEVATQTGSAVANAVHTMNDIRDSSSRIVDIIGVIDGIAFQTNILALNAAVEAARAGEQGRGFAVVASEVRTLAQRSASAAQDIKNLIDNSVERINVGNSQITAAGESVTGLTQSIKDVALIMDEITSASQEQSIGIGEIGQAVRQIDDTTQQNAALVEQATAAAQSLAAQASRLKEIVGQFKLQRHQTVIATPRPTPTARPTRRPPALLG